MGTHEEEERNRAEEREILRKRLTRGAETAGIAADAINVAHGMPPWVSPLTGLMTGSIEDKAQRDDNRRIKEARDQDLRERIEKRSRVLRRGLLAAGVVAGGILAGLGSRRLR